MRVAPFLSVGFVLGSTLLVCALALPTVPLVREAYLSPPPLRYDVYSRGLD